MVHFHTLLRFLCQRLFKKSSSPRSDLKGHESSASTIITFSPGSATPSSESKRSSGGDGLDIYYNPKLDSKNYLEGPLSHNPSTRLRQMARPGLVVNLLRPQTC